MHVIISGKTASTRTYIISGVLITSGFFLYVSTASTNDIIDHTGKVILMSMSS